MQDEHKQSLSNDRTRPTAKHCFELGTSRRASDPAANVVRFTIYPPEKAYFAVKEKVQAGLRRFPGLERDRIVRCK